MKKSFTADLSQGLIRLLWLGVLAAWTVYGLYIYNFGPGQWFKLSHMPSDWGVFGDYVGGLLNPFFSFLAFIGVIFTVILQARQLDIVREHANFEEIQRVLSTLSARIDGLLAAVPTATKDRFQHLNAAPRSIFELISAMGTLQLNKPDKAEDNWLRWATTEQQINELVQTVNHEIVTIGLELETLAWTLGRYASEGGSATVMDFYRYRYRAVLTWLDSMGLLEQHGQIQAFFKPKESSKYMTQNPLPPAAR